MSAVFKWLKGPGVATLPADGAYEEMRRDAKKATKETLRAGMLLLDKTCADGGINLQAAGRTIAQRMDAKSDEDVEGACALLFLTALRHATTTYHDEPPRTPQAEDLSKPNAGFEQSYQEWRSAACRLGSTTYADLTQGFRSRSPAAAAAIVSLPGGSARPVITSSPTRLYTLTDRSHDSVGRHCSRGTST